jgi:predicted small secreted protein
MASTHHARSLAMRTYAIVAAVGLSLALAACSRPTQEKAGADLKAIGSDVSAAAKDVANAPAAKALGSDIKAGATEAAEKTKEGADKAAEKIKETAKTAGAKTGAALNKAKDDAQKP